MGRKKQTDYKNSDVGGDDGNRAVRVWSHCNEGGRGGVRTRAQVVNRADEGCQENAKTR